MTLIKAVLLSLTLVGMSLAQSFPELNGYVATDSSQLDLAELNAAAEELASQGVKPLVVFVEADVGDSLAEAESYFGEALNAYELAQGDELDPKLYALFVGTRALADSSGTRPLFFKLGDDLVRLLRDDFAAFDARLQSEVMIPSLVAGDFSTALEDGLEFLDSQLNPSQAASEQASSSAASPQPVSPSNQPDVSSEPTPPLPVEQTNPFGRGFFIFSGLLALALIVSRFFKRSSKSQQDDLVTIQNAEPQKSGLTQATLSELSALLIDLNSADPKPGDAYLPQDMTRQSDMALLTGLLTEERPVELENLQDEYRSTVSRLHRATQRFNTLRNDATAAQPDYEALLSELRDIKGFSTRLGKTFEEVQQEISELDPRINALDARLSRAKAAYEAARGSGWPDTLRVFAPLTQKRDEAQSLATKNPLVALRILAETETKLSLSEDAVARLAETEKRLLGYRLSLEAQREQGYSLQDRDKRLEELEQNLDVALGLLQQSEPKILDAQMDEVVDLTDKLIDETKATVALHSSNAGRLEELAAAGESVKTLIDNAALAFDAVDDFAPNNWRDIRGNGTEAQKAAERAFTLFEQAENLNRLDGSQNFEGARDALAQGFSELEQAKLLCEAIHSRLAKLREAKNTARDQLLTVEEDITAHRQLLSQADVDREVSEVPSELLQKASEALEQAKPQLSAAQPDWLSILSLIQRADALCDKALAATRSEQDEMKHRRVRLASEQKEAEVALERVMVYARVHTHDLEAGTLETLQSAQAQFQAAQKHLEASQLQTDADLAASLEAAAAAFDRAEQSATSAFSAAEKDFELLDTLRASAAERVAAARASYDALVRLAERSGLQAERSLYALEADLPSYQANLGRSELESLEQRAQVFEERVKNLSAELEQDVREENALRAERERLLATERRQRAARRSRQNTAWGSSAPIIINTPRTRRPVQRAERRMPRATTRAPVRLPSRSSKRSSGRSSGRSTGRSGGGGWGGKGRSGGGGW